MTTQSNYLKVFHYTQFNNWRGIVKGTYINNHAPGLGPTLPLGIMNYDARKTRATYALLEALPNNWISNPHFKDIWSRLKASIGPLLLELTIDPTLAYVVERAHMEGYLYEDKCSIPAKYQHADREGAEGAYMLSRIPLIDYLGKNMQYSLPEVTIMESVPLERIAISDTQPILFEKLVEASNDVRSDLMFDIYRTQELVPWVRKNETILTEHRASLGLQNLEGQEGKFI